MTVGVVRLDHCAGSTPDELELMSHGMCAPACIERVEEHGNRVAAADRVAILSLVGSKARSVLLLDQLHTVPIERLDGLEDLSVARVMVSGGGQRAGGRSCV